MKNLKKTQIYFGMFQERLIENNFLSNKSPNITDNKVCCCLDERSFRLGIFVMKPLALLNASNHI
jgi:hypothetical protein